MFGDSLNQEKKVFTAFSLNEVNGRGTKIHIVIKRNVKDPHDNHDGILLLIIDITALL